ncbi:hypothetical protein KBD61_02045 [Patescibacteria group bacterium]|nr:hypothetical protein [Patescibacteria group bacterium]MBP9709790.1 hypothetical protein [Patescibacteria group bacterium]
MWIVKALIDGVFEHVSIPPGSWAVRVDEQEDIGPPDDETTGYKYRPCDTNVRIIGQGVQRLVLGSFNSGDHCRVWRCLYWSDDPFALIEDWQSPTDGQWVHLATEVNDHGMTTKLPLLPQPPHTTSRSGDFRPEHRRSKWVRLSDLADVLGVTPNTLLARHEEHFNGITCGIAVIYAETPDEVNRREAFELVWTVPDQEALRAHDPANVWVRWRFVLVAAYLNMLGYTG